METIYQQLKPEIKDYLNAKREVYPSTVETITSELSAVYYITDVTLKTFIAILALLEKETTYHEFKKLLNK